MAGDAEQKTFGRFSGPVEDDLLEKNKRKFFTDDPDAPPSIEPEPKAVGTYSNVPPPLTDFELAKKKAEELAAKYIADGEAKRMRKEPVHIQEPIDTSQDYQQTSLKKVGIPNNKVGLIIGKGGETIKYLQQQSGARIQVTRDGDADPSAPTRPLEIQGTDEQIALAEKLVGEILNGPVGYGNRNSAPESQDYESVIIRVPNNKVGLVIGRGGETIKALQSKSGAKVQVQNDKEMEPGATERIVTVSGQKSAVNLASQYVAEVIDENRPRGPPSFMQDSQQSSQWGGQTGSGSASAYSAPAGYTAPGQYSQQYPPQSYPQYTSQYPQAYQGGYAAPYPGYYAPQPAPAAGAPGAPAAPGTTAAQPGAEYYNQVQQGYYSYPPGSEAYAQAYAYQYPGYGYGAAGGSDENQNAAYANWAQGGDEPPGAPPGSGYAQENSAAKGQSGKSGKEG